MGPVNSLLAALGVENLPRWAAGKDTAMLTVILFSVWKNMGYYMVIYLAGLQGCNPDLNEAAELDGANRCSSSGTSPCPSCAHHLLRGHHADHLGLQSVRPDVHDHPGRPRQLHMTLVYYIYNVAFVNTPKYGYASAIAMVLFVLVLIVTIVQFRGSRGEN